MKYPEGGAFYVALGSSFAAGLGLGRRSPSSPIISMRSCNGYPQQLARLLQVPSFTDMTSSGATIEQVFRKNQSYLAAQVNGLGTNTALVTLTAGGNDVKYIGDLMALAYANRKGLVGLLMSLVWRGPKPAQERDFSGLAANYRDLLVEIGRRSPRARVVVVTYPTILPANTNCVRLGLTDEQVVLMRGISDMLANVTRQAALEAGADLIDMAALSIDNTVCSSEPWVNGPSSKKGDGAAFHPTLAGAKAIAETIFKELTKNSNIDEWKRKFANAFH